MNSYNTEFKQRVDKASLALNYLVKRGIAITSLSITDTGTVIEILPPPKPKTLRGTLITITNSHQGRSYLMATRLYNCTIRWACEQDEHKQYEEKKTCNA